MAYSRIAPRNHEKGVQRMKISGAWSEAEIASFIDQAVIPLRLAVFGGGGIPLPLSLWFLRIDRTFWCATTESAQLVGYLKADGRCGFELAGDAPPYRGVRGQAIASIVPAEGGRILTRLMERYSIRPHSRLARTLTARADKEVAIRIDPDWITSWDFSQRMADSINPEP